MQALINTAIIIVSFTAMEGVAWLMHKHVMHGFLWFLHKDHHQVNHKSFFELNDFFFLIFAIPGIILIYLGYSNFSFPFFIGLGITIYGAAYFTVHDIFIHQRFHIFKRSDIPYFQAIRKAHKIHHKKHQKEDGECFGMLWVPIKYFKEAKR